jgi:hypothetical protein
MVIIHCTACKGEAQRKGAATILDGEKSPYVREARQGPHRVASIPTNLVGQAGWDIDQPELRYANVVSEWPLAVAADPLTVRCPAHGVVSVSLGTVIDEIASWRADPRRRIRHVRAQSPLE